MARITLVVACVVLCALLCQAVRRSVTADASILRTSLALNSSALKTARTRAHQFLTFILEASGRTVSRQDGTFPDPVWPNYRPAAQGAATAYLVTGEKSLFHGTPITWPIESEVRHGSFWALEKGYAGIGFLDKTYEVSVSARMLTYDAPDPPLSSGFVLIQNRDGYLDDASGDLALSPALEALSKTTDPSLEPAEVPPGTKGNIKTAWRFCNYVKPANNHNPPENWAGLINYLPYAQTYGSMVNVWMKYNQIRHYNCPSPPSGKLDQVTCTDRRGRDVPNGFYAYFRRALEAINPDAANKRPGRIGVEDWRKFLAEGDKGRAVNIQQMLKVDEYEVVACKTPGELQVEESIYDLLEFVKWKTIQGHSLCKDTPYGTLRPVTLDNCKKACFEAAPGCSVIGFKDTTCRLYSKCDLYWYPYRGSGYRLEELSIPDEETLAEWMNKDLYENEVQAWPRFSIDFLSWAPTVKKKLITAKDDLVKENTEILATLFKNQSSLQAFIALLGSPKATRQAEKTRILDLRRRAGQLRNALR